MNSQNFFSELKRRNVFRAAAFYAAGAWLLVQVATQVFPFFHVPESIVRWIVVVAVIGFPFWLALAWFYEWTSQGLQRESDSPTPLSTSARASRRNVDRWIIVMLAAAVLLLLADKFLFRGRSAKITSAAEKSIAVLPFDNLSRDPDNAYFCEGVQDEILTRLAKVADLKVISRTSTQHFKSAPDNLPEIAKKLGVMHILEGSVQKASDQVRVNVQLINALTDAHLWADTYDRKLTDIFAVESEIAKTIAETLRAKITGSEKSSIAKAPTANTEAYQLYLKGRYFWNKRGPENLRKAIDFFQKAIDQDPSYALAYSGLGDAHGLLPMYAGTPPKDDIPKALVAARKAVELDESLAEAHTCLANALVQNVQLVAAEPEFRRAIELNPNYATAHQWFGESLQGQGRFAEALSELQRAHELDPLSPIINASFGSTLATTGRTEEAIEQVRRTIDFDPALSPAHEILGQIYEHNGKISEAIAEYDKARQLNAAPTTLAMLAHAYVTAGRTSEAREILADLTNLSRQHYIAAYPLAVVHLALGEKEEALRLLEQSLAERCIYFQGMFGSIKTDKRLDPLRDDPRFQKLLEKFLSGNF